MRAAELSFDCNEDITKSSPILVAIFLCAVNSTSLAQNTDDSTRPSIFASEFVEKAGSGGLAEVEMGELGAQKATSGQVKAALCVQDTGSGFSSDELPIRQELKDATVAVQEIEDQRTHGNEESLHTSPPETLTSRSPNLPRSTVGEGIGLSIVKRLCELLDASIELQSAKGQGTTFRVIFPLRYADGSPPAS